MFIKLFAAIFDPAKETFDTEAWIWFDATRINIIAQRYQGDKTFSRFVMEGELYKCDMSAEALVELVIEARLHPAQCLPNVGKPKDESRVGERLRLNADEK